MIFGHCNAIMSETVQNTTNVTVNSFSSDLELLTLKNPQRSYQRISL